MRKSRVDDGARGSVRKSKIAVPVKRASSILGQHKSSDHRRSVSEDRGGFVLKKNSLAMPSSYSGRKRSTSATPMRTPMKTPSQSAPMSSVRKTPMPDKKFVTEQITRVFNYIGRIDGLDRNFVNSRDCKMMTTNDFLRIISHLAKFWTPKVQFTNNYQEEIHNLLITIGYPYNFNKSWLKTINAPHAINHIFVMIAWLLNGVPEESSNDEEEEGLMDPTKFPSTAYAKFFEQKVQESYGLWNNRQDDEYAEVKQDIINEFFSETVQLPSESVVMSQIEQREGVLGEIEKEYKVYREKLEQRKAAKDLLKQKEDEKEAIQAQIAQKKKDLQGSKQQFHILEEALAKIKAEKKKNQAELKKQKAEKVKEKYAELMDLMHELKMRLQALKEHEDQMQNVGFNIQVEKSRLLKRRLDLVNSINLLMHQTTLNCPPDLAFNDLNLDLNAENREKVPLIRERLKSVEKYFKKVQKRMKTLTHLKEEKEELKEIKKKHEETLATLQEKIEGLAKARKKDASTIRANIATMEEKIKTKEESLVNLDAKIATHEARITKALNDQRIMMEYFKTKGKEALAKSREILKECKATADFLDDELEKCRFPRTQPKKD